MRRLLIVLVTSLVLGLAASVGTALASTPGEPGLPLQSATQSNEGTNTAKQSGISAPVVVSGPNIAVANGVSDGKSSCSPCGGSSGNVDQNSGSTVDASVVNAANQANNQSNDLGQGQTVAADNNGCCREAGKGSSASQSAEQSNRGTNDAYQSGISAPVVVSGPNIAVLDKGDVKQNSGNTVDASTTNFASQSNNQSNSADQSQTVAADNNGCCREDRKRSSASQSAEQSNRGTNDAYQSGISAPVVVSGPNIAVLNKGDVNQNSGNTVYAPVTNSAQQTNNQSNDLDQHQKVWGGDGNCCSKDGGSGATQTAEQSNEGTNEAKQSGISAPIVVSGPNVAIANGWGRDRCNPCGDGRGSVDQNSGNTVDAPVTNSAQQTNNQSNDLDQHQKVWGGDGNCCSKDGGSGATQAAEQSNEGTNKADQSGISAPIVVSGPNIAALNKGDVNQNSGNTVNAPVTNSAQQTNNQSNHLDQHQKVRGRNGCQPRCKPECKPSCEPRPCQPKCD